MPKNLRCILSTFLSYLTNGYNLTQWLNAPKNMKKSQRVNRQANRLLKKEGPTLLKELKHQREIEKKKATLKNLGFLNWVRSIFYKSHLQREIEFLEQELNKQQKRDQIKEAFQAVTKEQEKI